MPLAKKDRKRNVTPILRDRPNRPRLTPAEREWLIECFEALRPNAQECIEQAIIALHPGRRPETMVR